MSWFQGFNPGKRAAGKAPNDMGDAKVDHLVSFVRANDFSGVVVAVEEWSVRPDVLSEEGQAAFHVAAKCGRLQMIKYFIKQRADFDLNKTARPNKYTALHYATAQGQVACTQYLLEQGMDPNAPDVDGRTPVHCAAHSGNVELLQVLLKYGGSFDTRTEAWGLTVLHCAARGGVVDAVSFLVEQRWFDCHVKDSEGWTCLHHGTRYNHIEVVDYLLKNTDIDVNAVITAQKYGGRGMTSLHMAARHGHVNIIKRLLEERNIDTSIKDDKGRTALDVAVSRNKREAMDALEEYLKPKDLPPLEIVESNPSILLNLKNQLSGQEELKFGFGQRGLKEVRLIFSDPSDNDMQREEEEQKELPASEDVQKSNLQLKRATSYTLGEIATLRTTYEALKAVHSTTISDLELATTSLHSATHHVKEKESLIQKLEQTHDDEIKALLKELDELSSSMQQKLERNTDDFQEQIKSQKIQFEMELQKQKDNLEKEKQQWEQEKKSLEEKADNGASVANQLLEMDVDLMSDGNEFSKFIEDVDDCIQELDEQKEKLLAAKKDAEETQREKRICVVCMDHPGNCVFLPCRHQRVCEECAKDLDECPMDRMKIEQKITVFA